MYTVIKKKKIILCLREEQNKQISDIILLSIKLFQDFEVWQCYFTNSYEAALLPEIELLG